MKAMTFSLGMEWSHYVTDLIQITNTNTTEYN